MNKPHPRPLPRGGGVGGGAVIRLTAINKIYRNL